MAYIQIIEEDERFELRIEDSVFSLRRFDSTIYSRIEKKHTKNIKNRKTGAVTVEIDNNAVNADLLDYIICDWSGIQSPTTKTDVPCTKENKLRLPSNIKVQVLEACDADYIVSTEKKSVN